MQRQDVTPPAVFHAAPVSDARASLGESPLWDEPVGIRWLDLRERSMFTHGHNGQVSRLALSTPATAIELGPGGTYLVVTRTGFGRLDPATGVIDKTITVLHDESIQMNDGGIDPYGRCWAGSAVRDGSWRGQLYRLERDDVTHHIGQLGMSNGIDWSPAGDVLYHADSTAGTVKAWEYDLERGELGTSRVLRTVPSDVGLPDGLTVDADGQVWLAVWGTGQVWRLSPDSGDITAVVDVPTPYPTSCAFGGSGLSTLYITTANHREPSGGGMLYAVELPVSGRTPNRFAEALR